jgi:hypothetical protein
VRFRANVVCAAAAVLCAAFAPNVGAQAKRLTYARDTSFNLVAMGVRRVSTVLVRKDGYMVVAPEYFYGEALAFDSAGKKQPWSVTFGRGSDSEIGWAQQWGWAGDSVWVVDRMYEQVALLGSDGKIAQSVGFPSWVRPSWGDRRQYPLFSTMAWHAMYSDGSLLVEPSQVRRLFDTPAYDPDQKLLVRIDRDGKILHTVARIPAMDGRLTLRTGAERKVVNIPFHGRSHWKVSSDGERVAVVTPLTSDSGAFRVTMLNSMGDTVYSRRYTVDARRVPTATADSFAANVAAFGRYTKEQMRDTVRKLMAEWGSPVMGVQVGVDHSAWVSFRTPTTATVDAEWMVIDAKGDVVGTTVLLRQFKVIAATVDRIWTVEHDRAKQASLVVRYARSAKAVRPTRSASASASLPPSRRPQ